MTLHSFFFFFLDRLSLSGLGLPGTHNVVEVNLELEATLLPQPPECLDYYNFSILLCSVFHDQVKDGVVRWHIRGSQSLLQLR